MKSFSLIGQEAQAQFDTWLQTAERELGWKARPLDAAQPLVQETAFIRFSPENVVNGKDAYTVTIWHRTAQNTTNITPSDLSSPINVADNATREHLRGSLLEQLKRHLESNRRIEFIVPVELLLLAVERWELSRGKGTRKTFLGCDYEITLRSYERWYEPDYCDITLRNELGRYWTEWTQCNVMPSFCPSADVVPDSPQALVALTFHLPDESDKRKGIFWTLFDASVPIILFPRATYPEARVSGMQIHIDELIKHAGGRTALPTTLLTQRKRGPDALAHHIALIWDDPERLPPEVTPLSAA